MEKNRMHPLTSGKNTRMSYSKQREVLELPNLIDIQKKSYEWFLSEGLKEVFEDISPITDYSGSISLSFEDFHLYREETKYTIEECKERDATYAAPMRVRVTLKSPNKELKTQEIFMGDMPLMTDSGSFVINGAERVIVSQLVRSPGIYYSLDHDKLGKALFSSQVIPNRGAWLEYETDSNDVFWARVDRTRKVPVTTLIRALGVGTNEEILEKFGDLPLIRGSLAKDNATGVDDGLLKLYDKIRPGERLLVENARSLFHNMLFEDRRYDLARVGRYKFNKKLQLKRRVTGLALLEDVIGPDTGEVVAKAGEVLTAERADEIQNSGVESILVDVDGTPVRVLSNRFVDMSGYVTYNPRDYGVKELVHYEALMGFLEAFPEEEEQKEKLPSYIRTLVPKHVTEEDIFASISYCCTLQFGLGNVDDIDHLGNRRIRAVGELLQNQYRIGLTRLERVVRDRMTTQDQDSITAQSFFFSQPFFGASCARIRSRIRSE